MKNKEELIRGLKFFAFSVSAGVIQAALLTLLYEVAHLREEVSYIIALVASVVWNFTFNRKFTFKSAANVPIAMLKVFGYYCVFAPLSYFGEKYLCGIGWNYYLVSFGFMVINLVTEYLFCKFAVYRGKMNTNAAAKKKQSVERSEQPADGEESDVTSAF